MIKIKLTEKLKKIESAITHYWSIVTPVFASTISFGDIHSLI
jgi:hypothetical protein